MSELPEQVQALIGEPRYRTTSDTEVSRGNIRAMCATVQNGNPLYWQPEKALEVTGVDLAPTAMLSNWSRPERWAPGEREIGNPLQLHYDLKEAFDYPTAIVGSFESVYHTPVAVGDRIDSCQILRSVSDEKQTRLGIGRFWVIEMHYHNQHGELLGVDTFNCFGYRKVQP